MANAKKISLFHSSTAATVYCIVRRASDGYLLNDADGAFAAAPADPYLALAEDATIKGLYEVSESRTAWAAGKYEVFVYAQAGGSPAPASDTMIGAGEMQIDADTEQDIGDLLDKEFGKRELDQSALTTTHYRRDGTVLKVFDHSTSSVASPPFISAEPRP